MWRVGTGRQVSEASPQRESSSVVTETVSRSGSNSGSVQAWLRFGVLSSWRGRTGSGSGATSQGHESVAERGAQQQPSMTLAVAQGGVPSPTAALSPSHATVEIRQSPRISAVRCKDSLPLNGPQPIPSVCPSSQGTQELEREVPKKKKDAHSRGWKPFLPASPARV